MQNHASTLAAEFKLDAARVAATVALIDEGNTIPFIARYRKEATGSMDDQTLRALDERLSYLRKLDDQKETVHNSITEQGAMTPEIAAALEKAKTLAEVEDIYRPYKPKRKTRASIARARGLEPLAARLLEQRPEDEPALLARQYITEEVPDTEAALAARGIFWPRAFQIRPICALRCAACTTQRHWWRARPRKKIQTAYIRAITITASPPQKWRATAFWPWTEARGRAS